MKIVSVVGARPQFIKAAPVCRVLRQRHEEILVHSGQHYDHGMSAVFFEELGIPEPDYNLAVGSGLHGQMTGMMLVQLEELLIELAPDLVLVYGDTNTTLAAVLAAVKLQTPCAHVEAGLRSFDRTIPEEINRITADHLSELLLCPTQEAMVNCDREGLADRAVLVGDVMLDTLRIFSEKIDDAAVLAERGLAPGGYFYSTTHRPSNVDDRDILEGIVQAFGRLDLPVVWAVHPRTRASLRAFGLAEAVASDPNIIDIDPVPYIEGVTLLRNAAAMITDSGGMQKEAYFLGVPCVTLRDQTEWVETVEHGWNTLAGTDPEVLLAAAAARPRPSERPAVYGEGHAAEEIVAAIENRFGGSA